MGKPTKTGSEPLEPKGPGVAINEGPSLVVNSTPGFLLNLFFAHVDKIIRHGYKYRLEPEETIRHPAMKIDVIHGRFEEAWAKELENATEEKPASLRRTICVGHSWTFFYTGVLYLIATGSTFAGPIILNRIVKGLQCRGAGGENCDSMKTLYLFACGLLIAPVIESLCQNHMMFGLNFLGTQMRNSLMAAIYRKCMRLNNASLQAESAGKIVTLMSNDAKKIQDATTAIHAIWGSPLYIVGILIFLYTEVQWATFVGLAGMIALVPLTGFVAKKLAMYRKSIVGFTDKRVGLMSELINGMRVIKFYAWEKSFKDTVMAVRDQEATILRKTAVYSGLFGMVLFSGPVVVAIGCFGSYSLAGNTLDTAQAYTALALFTMLRFPMSFLPMFVTLIVNANISLKRIQGFLTRGEVSPSDLKSDPSAQTGFCSVHGGEFSWNDEDEAPILKDVDFEIAPGSLTLVVGAVGSGKSSLLATLLGNITRNKGQTTVCGSVAYVAQSAWIVNDTVQNNIVMGAPFDADAYMAACEAAQLLTDLESFEDGDQTEIGERGITLSGGQKQRVSIARAVYADADIVLLDDPLSAVDVHVGKGLMDDCFTGALKGKTVVMVANQLQYMANADHIIWVEDGMIKHQGSYNDLTAAGVDWSTLSKDDVAQQDDDEAIAAKKKSGIKWMASRKQSRGVSRALSTKNVSTLTGVEGRSAGSVGGNVLAQYTKAAGGVVAIVLLTTLLASEQTAKVMTDFWVGLWAEDRFNQPLGFYLGLYLAIGASFGAIVFLRSLFFCNVTVTAAVALHNRLLTRLLRLPMSFFDTNPSGRVLNRFSRDTEVMDTNLQQSMIQFLGCVSNFFGIIVVISLATPFFLCAILPIVVVYYFIQRYYIPAGRELQRIESITRSPIYSGFKEAVDGVVTIRAFGKQEFFTKTADERLETNAAAFVTQKSAASWLAMRLDFIGMLIVALAGLLAVNGGINPALAGLSLVYALDVTKYLKHGTAMASMTESDFNAVERVTEYLDPGLEEEAPMETDPSVEKGLPKNWPEQGALSVKGLTMRYRKNTPIVLNGVSFSVAPGQRIGICGRTGSGKSSMFLALFRMVEPEGGSITIDGVDIGRLGLSKLRSVMSMIPQDPFMFSGTVRRNLDPFDMHSDERLWNALDSVGLKTVIAGFDEKLEKPVVDNGANFSQGQRQLFCLARALLRDSKILMMDEATASVDMATDALIQETIRTSFKDVTILTIAHRLNTIMDSDKVLVMKDGNVAEFDTPDALLETPGSLFAALVDDSGKANADVIRDASKKLKISRSVASMKGLIPSEIDPGTPLGASPSPLGASPSPTPIAAVGQADDASSVDADQVNPAMGADETAPLAGGSKEEV